MSWRIIEGDCRDVLRSLPAQSVHTCVTSPPYYGLRDYGTGEWEGGDPACDHLKVGATGMRNNGRDRAASGGTFHGAKDVVDGLGVPYAAVCGKCGARRVDRQIGLEPTPDEFVAALVAVFREVRRVLRDDGTVWLNLGDSYARGFGGGSPGEKSATNAGSYTDRETRPLPPGLKSKDLVGIPWMVAFALRADGWYLRSDIIWAKPNPMPESVTDRPTKAHEYLFLLSKGPRYFYDADAIREDGAGRLDFGQMTSPARLDQGGPWNGGQKDEPNGRNKRSVWTIATQPYAGAHFATFPPKLIEPCILAGAPERACGECGAPWVRVREMVGYDRQRWAPGEDQYHTQANGKHGATSAFTTGDVAVHRTVGFEPSCSHGDGSASGVVLDPFAGAGTTGMVALRHNRSFVGIELNPEYARMARERIVADAPLLNQVSEVAA